MFIRRLLATHIPVDTMGNAQSAEPQDSPLVTRSRAERRAEEPMHVRLSRLALTDDDDDDDDDEEDEEEEEEEEEKEEGGRLLTAEQLRLCISRLRLANEEGPATDEEEVESFSGESFEEVGFESVDDSWDWSAEPSTPGSMDSLLSGTPPSPTWVMCASNQNRNPHSNQARPCQQELKIPVQVWAHICSYLYPSQLAQLSLVNRTAYEIVAGLETWSKWYRRLSGKAEKLARQTEPMELLPGLPESRSYMLYMCAISFQVCEGCFRRCDGRRIRGRLALMPLPVVLSNGDGEGGSGNERERGEGGELWTVRLCKHCRVMHYEKHPEAIPQELTTKFLTRREIKAQYHLGKSEIKAIKVRSHGERSMCMPVTYSEAEALKTARVVFGGDVGRQAVPRSLCRPMAKVHHRVYMYNLRRRTLEAGGEWFRCQDYKARKAAGLLD